MENTLLLFLKHAWRLCSDVVFPRDIYAEALSAATLETFIERARRYTDTKPSPVPHLYVLYVYRDPFVRSAVHAAKYRGRKDVCILFGELLWHTFGEELSVSGLMLGAPWSVVGVPISKHRRRIRGYNQTEYIARGFLRHADASMYVPLAHVLCMAGGHTSQTRALKKEDRERNSIGSCTVSDPAAVAGKNIILIDDVVTTGATLREASRVLYAAGARRVYCLAVAH